MTNQLQVKTFPTGELRTNAYIVFDEKIKQACLIDCPAPVDDYLSFLTDNNLHLEFVAITHGHCDHIDGLNEVLKKFQTTLFVHKKDYPLLVNPLKNGSLVLDIEPISVKQDPLFYEEGEKIFLGENKLQVLETPGHTQGSVCLLVNNWLFSGDTLFFHSVGRTDLPFADEKTLRASIIEKLFKLEPNLVVYPGHGQSTTLAEEIKNNPFVS